VLADANCVTDAAPFNATLEYFDPGSTCIKFDNTASSCTVWKYVITPYDEQILISYFPCSIW
jgi:hypothetical protein